VLLYNLNISRVLTMSWRVNSRTPSSSELTTWCCPCLFLYLSATYSLTAASTMLVSPTRALITLSVQRKSLSVICLRLSTLDSLLVIASATLWRSQSRHFSSLKMKIKLLKLCPLKVLLPQMHPKAKEKRLLP